MKKNKKGGFTLLELLIVIAIIAILSVALVIVLNPAETLKKARDAQRISDLATMKTAIGLYMTSTASPILDGGTNANCKTSGLAAGTWKAGDKIFYSVPNTTLITDVALDGGTTFPISIQSPTPSVTSGLGWIPINFDSLTGGSPISNLPVDPTNTVTVGAVASTDLTYRYACALSPLSFEIDAQLESIAYTVTENKRLSDGGNSNLYYETGSNLLILGASASGADF